MIKITISRGDPFAIGVLSIQTGVNIETIRYYERIALLPSPPRSAGGRRVYSDSHARILKFIRRARELGFPIADIRTLLDMAEPDNVSCADVEKVARTHLETVRTKLADLVKLEKVLSETIDQCGTSDAPRCAVLDILYSR
jgi:MerR family transcriptional regulator, mercuric resistance operon regulatory protein